MLAPVLDWEYCEVKFHTILAFSHEPAASEPRADPTVAAVLQAAQPGRRQKGERLFSFACYDNSIVSFRCPANTLKNSTKEESLSCGKSAALLAAISVNSFRPSALDSIEHCIRGDF